MTTSSCVYITNNGTVPVVVQDCTGTHVCDAGCPGAETSLACVNADPCVLNECYSGCPNTMICGYCGNESTASTILDPNSPCYVKPYYSYCENTIVLDSQGNPTGTVISNSCKSGCPDTGTCGKCGNTPCVKACVTNHCGLGCADATTCGMCNNPECPSSITNACSATSCASGYICGTAGLCTLLPSGTGTSTGAGGENENSGTGTGTDTGTGTNGTDYSIDLSSIMNNLPLIAVIGAACILGIVLTRRK